MHPVRSITIGEKNLSLKADRCDSRKGWLVFGSRSEGSDVQEGAGSTIRSLIAVFISVLSDQTQVSTMTFYHVVNQQVSRRPSSCRT